MFFSSFADLGRTLVIGPLAYGALVLFLRASGKRTLTKLNAFDLVVTVALGSTLATILLNKSVSLAEGVFALGLLIALQFAITWSAVRAPWIAGFVKSEPTLLVRNGQFLEGALQSQRVTRDEVLAALRANGTADLARAAAVVLETDGSISVLKDPGSETIAPTLVSVEGARPEPAPRKAP